MNRFNYLVEYVGPDNLTHRSRVVCYTPYVAMLYVLGSIGGRTVLPESEPNETTNSRTCICYRLPEIEGLFTASVIDCQPA